MLIDKFTKIFGFDLRSLALLRISIALIGLVDLALRARDMMAHYSNSGVLPNAGNIISGFWQFPIPIFILAGLFFITLLLGYKTRWSTLLAFIFLLAIQMRNPMIFQKSDDILRLILLWGFFLPWGAVHSLDSAKTQPDKNQPKQIFSIATIAYFVQIMAIYIAAALLKSSPIWRAEGSAIFYALSSDHYTTAFGYFLLSFPSWVLQIITHSVWWFELLGIFLLIVPIFNSWFRVIGIVLFITLNIGFGLTMNLELFPWICGVAMLAFIPGTFWDWLRKILPFKKQREFTLYYDHTCSFCKKIVMVFKSFLFLPDMPCVSAQGNYEMLIEMGNKDSWIMARDSDRFYRFDVFVILLSVSPVFWPLEKLAKLKIIKIIGEKLYEIISANRNKICRIERPLKKSIFEKPTSIALQFVAGAFLFIVVFWNIGNVANNSVNLPKPLVSVAKAFHLDQKWDMFAPYPFTASYWYVIPGHLQDKSVVNMLNINNPVSWEKPKSIPDSYPSSRWQNYLMQLFSQKNIPLYVSYGKYVCQQWNNSHLKNKHLNNFEVFVMSRQNKFNAPPQPYVKAFIWRYRCQ